MEETDLEHVFSLLGEPPRRYEDAAAWRALERGLGVSLPAQFKEIVDGYAPVQINGHLDLMHPATERWNLGEWISSTAEAWAAIDWDEAGVEGDPRIALNVPQLHFGSPDGLIPLADTDRGETIFFAPRGGHGAGVLFVENGEGEFFEYAMDFAEWLRRWLAGEEVTGPGGSAFYPGPITLCDLPMTPEERPEVRYGPPRGV